MGYAVLPAQYVAQVSAACLQVRSSWALRVKSSYLFIFFFFDGLSAPAVSVRDSCQQLWFPGVQRDADSGQTAP